MRFSDTAARPGLVRPATLASALLVALGAASGAMAQDPADLAKSVANPVSDLVSVPFQLNVDDGVGPFDAERRVLNIQPVVPLRFSDDWTVISRTIIPVIDQPALVPGGKDVSGIGDIVQSFFLTPARPSGGVIWGAGLALLLPTATDDTLGADQWGAGPTASVLRQQGPLTVGALANHLWSLGNDTDKPDVNATFVQPFASYTTAGATTFGINSEITYDWTGETWSVPLNLTVSQLVSPGGQPLSISAGARYWLDSPEGGAEGWGLRLGVSFLYPK